MADSISPWLDWAALRWDSSYGSMVPENSHESYEAGSHAQILAFTSDPYAPHGLWIELSDRELIVSAFVPRAEIEAFNEVNSEQFLSQRHAVVTIERFNWIVEQPFYRTSVAAKHGEEQGYEPKARRVCIKVIAMKSLAPGLGNAVRGKGGAKLRELAHSTTPRTRAWVEECLDRYFNDKTFSKNQYIKIRGIGKPYRDGQLRREEEAAVGKMRATLATLATLHAAEEPVEVAAPPPGPRPRVLIPPRPTSARPSFSKDSVLRSRLYWFDDTLVHKSRIPDLYRTASLRETVVAGPLASARPSKSPPASPEQSVSTDLHTRKPMTSPQRAPRVRATVPGLPTTVCASSTEAATRHRALSVVPPLLPPLLRPSAASPLAAASHPTPAPTSTPPPAQKYAHDISLSDIPRGTGTTIASNHMPIQSQYSNHPPARQPRKRSRSRSRSPDDVDSLLPRNQDQLATASPEPLGDLAGDDDDEIVDDSEELEEGFGTDEDEFDDAQRPQSSFSHPLMAIEEFIDSESDEDEDMARVDRQLRAARSSVALSEMVVEEFKLGWEPPEDESQQTQLPSPTSIRAVSVPKIEDDLPEPMDVDLSVTQAPAPAHTSSSPPAPDASSPLSRRHSQQSVQRAASPPEEMAKPVVPLPHRDPDAPSPSPAPTRLPSPAPPELTADEQASLRRKERRAARKAQKRPTKSEWAANRIRQGLLVKD